MAWPPLFDQEKCDVPHVDKLDFRFISDCTILPAPPPIFDCPDIDIPFDVPPPPIPCPEIAISIDASIAMGTNPCEEPRFEVDATVTKMESCGSCDFLLDFDFNLMIPPPIIPCPEISADGTISVATGIAGCNDEPRVAITVTSTPGTDSCNSDNSCQFDFDFDFYIPIPAPPCPTLEGSATATININEGGEPTCEDSAAVTVDLSITPVFGEDSCNPSCEYQFDFNFDFTIPPPGRPMPHT